MCDLKTAFFVSADGREKCSARRQTQRPSSGMKEPFRGSVAHAYSPRGKMKSFLPKYMGKGVQKTICFPIHFWTGKKGGIDRRKSPVFVQEIRLLVSRTPPLYSSSFTYSIRSAGWQSKREQITSSVPHDGICPLLIFWSIASPIIFSLRMRVVL